MKALASVNQSTGCYRMQCDNFHRSIALATAIQCTHLRRDGLPFHMYGFSTSTACCDLDLQSLTRSLVGASEYSTELFPVSIMKIVQVVHDNTICLNERMNECGGWTAREHYVFTGNVGWQMHKNNRYNSGTIKLTRNIIMAPFIFANSNHTDPTQRIIQIKVGILSTFTPFNFTVLISSRNSRNKGRENIKGFTVSCHTK